jgi:hypothetical protein
MSEETKQIPSSNVRTVALLAFIAGIAAGFGMYRWQSNIARDAARAVSEERWLVAESEEWKQIQDYWDSKPEIARALLERQLRADERLLQTVKGYDGRRFVLNEENTLKDMGLLHMRLAILCRKMNEPNCVSQNVNEAARLTNASSNEVLAAMAKLEQTDRAHRLTTNE